MVQPRHRVVLNLPQRMKIIPKGASSSGTSMVLRGVHAYAVLRCWGGMWAGSKANPLGIRNHYLHASVHDCNRGKDKTGRHWEA